MHRQIPVYAAERRDGLAEQIQANASVSYLTPLLAATPGEDLVRRATAQAAARKIDDVTLIYFEDILATTGWNLNQDVFTHEELWAARRTIEHKPINLEHQYLQIMGHVAGSYAVDEAFNPIADDSAIDDLPAKFHVKNESVLYRQVGDPERDEFMANLEQEIRAGEWFVSMESFFNGFDYGLIGEDGSRAVLPRNNATAFLTKHMRQYGGDGVYTHPVDGRKYTLGRVMKNVHFKGKGVVRRPGNPESVIFAQTDAFHINPETPVYVLSSRSADEVDATHQESPMPESADPTAQTDLAALRERIGELEAENARLAAKESDSQIAALKASNDTLAGEVASLGAQNQAYTQNIADLNARVEGLQADLDAKAAALSAVEAERETSARLAVLVEKGADASLARELVEKFAAMSREAFEATATILAPSWKAAPAAPAPSRAEAEKAAIDAAVVEDAPALAVGEADEREAAKAALIDFYSPQAK